MDNNAVLVAAKQEYTSQLQDTLLESMYLCFAETWEVKGYTPLKDFQKKMCEIPLWNQMVIDSKVKDILDLNKISVEYLDKLVEAVFLSNIKILSVVKLNNKKHVVNVKVPSTRNFIHKCYIESARAFYTKPYVFDSRCTDENRNEKIKTALTVISDSIDKTIRNLIPMEDILNEYLNSNGDEEEITQEPTKFDVDEPDFETPESDQEDEQEGHREHIEKLEDEDDEFMKPPETMKIEIPEEQNFFD